MAEVDFRDICRHGENGSFLAYLADGTHSVLNLRSCANGESDDSSRLDIRFDALLCQPDSDGDEPSQCSHPRSVEINELRVSSVH